MTDWQTLESPLKPVLDGGIFVEKKDRNPAGEEARQAEFVNLMRRTCKACKVYAVPNAGKRTRWEANKAKREGLFASWPDIGVVWADGRADIEFKDGQKMPRDDQIETLNWLHLRGHPVAVCRTAEGAMRWLASLGAPVLKMGD